MHKMESPNRLMNEKGTLQKILKIFPCGTFIFNTTLSSELTPHLAQISNTEITPSWWPFILLPDPNWSSRFQTHSEHTAKNQIQTIHLYRVALLVKVTTLLVTSLADNTETIKMLIWLFSMTFKGSENNYLSFFIHIS